jgi:hypothetical protein
VHPTSPAAARPAGAAAEGGTARAVARARDTLTEAPLRTGLQDATAAGKWPAAEAASRVVAGAAAAGAPEAAAAEEDHPALEDEAVAAEVVVAAVAAAGGHLGLVAEPSPGC